MDQILRQPVPPGETARRILGDMKQVWHERHGRAELWRGGRCIAVVQQVRGKWTVTIDAREPWQVVKGRAGSMAMGRRHIERWLRARNLLDPPSAAPETFNYVPTMGHLIQGDSRSPEQRAEAERKEHRRRKNSNPNWWKNEQPSRPRA